MNQSRMNKIAKLMEISKRAELDPILTGWIDFYRRTFKLEECDRKREINKLNKEQAMHFYSVISDLERSGAVIPHEYKEDVMTRALGRDLLCVGDVLSGMATSISIALDIVGSIDALGPMATLADATSAGISFYLGDNVKGVISLLSMIPNSDWIFKPIMYTIQAARWFNRGNAVYEVGGTVITPEDLKPAANFLLTNLKHNEDKILPLLVTPSLQDGYREIIYDLESYS